MDSIHFSSGNGEWETPKELFQELNKEFHFTIDAAATPLNTLCGRYWTKEIDAFKQDWSGEIVWLNPPYSRDVGKWVKKSYDEAKKGATVVILLAARTDCKWFHEYCYKKAEVRFIKGRLKFGIPGGKCNPAPFPSMVVVFKPQSKYFNT